MQCIGFVAYVHEYDVLYLGILLIYVQNMFEMLFVRKFKIFRQGEGFRL